MIKTITATAWIAGLILAGAETPNYAWNIAGLILFVGGSCGLAWRKS